MKAIHWSIFLLLNFAALAIGGLFTSGGVSSDWYANLNKAPWTPPGWVFGVAWSSIMLAFTFYMMWWWNATNNKKRLIILYAIQWLLNVSWNPTFFYARQTGWGLVLIMLLTVLVTYFLFTSEKLSFYKRLAVLPYFSWLLIATSLNLYIVLKN